MTDPSAYVGKQLDTTELEAEVKALKEEREQMNAPNTEELEVKSAVEDEALPSDERVWAGRYGDLRKHSANKEQGFKEEIEQLRAAKLALEADAPLPASEENLKEWAEKFPDLSDVIVSISAQASAASMEKVSREVEAKLAQLEDANKRLEKEASFSKVEAAHPDCKDIIESVEFHDWVKTKTARWEETVYESQDHKGIIEAIDWYKSENPPAPVRGRPKKDAAAAAASNPSKSGTNTPANDKSNGVIKQSDLMKLDGDEFVKAYREAKASGKLVLGQ